MRTGRGFLSIHRASGLVGLSLVALIAWAFLVASHSAMGNSTDGFLGSIMRPMMHPQDRGPYLLAASAMWVVMMLAMMVPPALLTMVMFRRMRRGDAVELDSVLMASGYLVSWLAFAVVASFLQWGLHSRGLIQGMALQSTTGLTAGLLIAAGLYQLTPLKDSCLARCRSPMGFFLEHWREGRLGAFSMGCHHGLFCMGCCWLLMLLMFAGGTMSVATMAALCALIMAERLVPPGPWVSRIPGVALVAFGVWVGVTR